MTLKRSFPPVADTRTRLLICGSLPGDRSLAAGWYYAHPQNQFWQLLSPVAGVDLAALDYDARLAALLAARIGLWDVVACATRPGSSDAAIRDHAANDPADAARYPAPISAQSRSTAPPRTASAASGSARWPTDSR